MRASSIRSRRAAQPPHRHLQPLESGRCLRPPRRARPPAPPYLPSWLAWDSFPLRPAASSSPPRPLLWPVSGAFRLQPQPELQPPCPLQQQAWGRFLRLLLLAWRSPLPPLWWGQAPCHPLRPGVQPRPCQHPRLGLDRFHLQRPPGRPRLSRVLSLGRAVCRLRRPPALRLRLLLRSPEWGRCRPPRQPVEPQPCPLLSQGSVRCRLRRPRVRPAPRRPRSQGSGAFLLPRRSGPRQAPQHPAWWRLSPRSRHRRAMAMDCSPRPRWSVWDRSRQRLAQDPELDLLPLSSGPDLCPQLRLAGTPRRCRLRSQGSAAFRLL